MKEPVREFSGKIIGWVETENDGSQIVRAFSGKIIAKYDARFNVTREFSGKVLTQGNTAVGQLFNPSINTEYKP